MKVHIYENSVVAFYQLHFQLVRFLKKILSSSFNFSLIYMHRYVCIFLCVYVRTSQNTYTFLLFINTFPRYNNIINNY